MNIVGVKESRDNLACAMMIEMMITFLTKGSRKSIRLLLVCIARGPVFRTGGKIAFFWQISRVSVFALCTEYNSAKNATLDASAAAHTAENEAKQVLLVLTCRKEQE